VNPGDLTTIDNVRAWLGLAAAAIGSITQSNPGVVTTVAPTGVVTGLPVTFTTSSMAELDGVTALPTVIAPNQFQIDVDTSAFSAYTGGGFITLQDAALQRMISACSAYIQNVLNRNIASARYTEARSGQGARQMQPAQYPVTAVNSLTINGVSIPSRPPFSAQSVVTTVGFFGGVNAGFSFDDMNLYVDGYYFIRGYQNIAIDYVAGFLISDEPQTVPSAPPYRCVTVARWAASDGGVTYAANGVALTAVAANPAQGQYVYTPGGTYTFSAADAGAAVLISYGYVPYDLEQACVDMIGDWIAYQSRIGMLSKTIEAQTVTFVNAALPARTKGVLDQYKRVAPVL
jgi:hypothetical protein